jgi:hypothetical protein
VIPEARALTFTILSGTSAWSEAMPAGATYSGEHVVVWDLETIPDAAAGARIAGTPPDELDEPKENEKPKFPKLPLHQIACIGALIAEKEEAGCTHAPKTALRRSA